MEDVGAELDALRNKLVKALRVQQAVGGVERDTLASLTADDCTHAIRLEWKLVGQLKIWPGMPMHEIERAAKRVPPVRHARRMVAIWGATRELIRRPDIAISGCLVLAENSNGERLIRHHGIAPVRKQWQAPTLIMDATLPGMPILQAYYPQVMLKTRIEAAMPHVRIRQILKAPVSARRLIKTSSDINRKAIRRYVLERWLETGQHPTLVVCQKKVEEWLKASGLPETIAGEHFNNISGIDRYKDVRLLILIGRTIPGPEAVEIMAGALTGAEPSKTKKASNGIGWYDRIARGIRLTNGTGVAVECDQHPDPAAEAVRWQICEGELVQALGRGRGVNRTINTPLDIDIVADVCLPVTVDDVRHWVEPNEAVEMAVEGIGLTSPVDMVRVWPNIWANTRAANRTLQLLIRLCRDVPEAHGLTGPNVATKSLRIYYRRLCRDVRLVRYQLSGPRTNRRTAFVDLARLPDPRTWLERRLGPLAYFEIE
jgi:putative DNA primase/helicase